MCGICGVMHHGNAYLSDTLEILSKIRHRGPDSLGLYIDGNTWKGKCLDDFKGINRRGNISLGQSRLEIVGGEKGRQPISSSRLTIVHNGEIYNHRQLKSLIRHNQMNSESDSEILVNFIDEFYESNLLEAVKKALPFKMAKKAARELELDLKVSYLAEENIKDLLKEIIESIELNGLLQVEVAIPMYIAAQSCSNDGHKVMFSGQAADELFAGYSWYKDIVRENGHLTLHHKLWEDIEYLYLDTLEREDRMAMAHAIEIRAPFLDRELIRTVMRIAPHLKIKDGENSHRKLVHRKLALRKGIPMDIAFRPKAPAQDGTGVHNIIKALAFKHFKNRNFEEADLLDYGSNYRYLDEDYGTPEMMAFLSEITSKNNVEFLATDNENSQISRMVEFR